MSDGACGAIRAAAIVSYRQMLQDGGKALVGAARSAVSKPLATLGKSDKMPQARVCAPVVPLHQAAA